MALPYAAYGLILAAATLNRNSSILLVLAYFAANAPRLRERRVLTWGLAYLLEWALIYGALVLARPAPSEWATPAAILAANVGPWFWQFTIPHWLALLPLALLTLAHYRRAPAMLRRLMWIVPVYLVPLAVYGAWFEIRLLLPVWPIMLATVVYQRT